MKNNHKRPASTKPPQNLQKESSNKYRNYLLAAVLLFTAIIYWPSLKNDYVAGDDYIIVADNPDIRSLRNVPAFFTQSYHTMYCPVKMMSHAIDHLFSGQNPAGYHFFSLLYHLVNVALVFYLIFLLLSNAWAAVIGALLFAIHPINVEAVCWLTGRGDLLYGGFYFGGLIAYIYYLKKGYQRKYLVTTFLLFVLSALSKASAFTFPLTLIVLDWYYHRKLLSKRVILEKIPFLLGALALGISVILMRGTQHSVSLSEYFKHFTGIDNFAILIYPLTFYLAKFFVPYKLALPYPHPFASQLPLSLDFYLYPLILVVLLVLIWRCKSIRRPLAFAVLFYLAALVSALRLSPMLGTIAADRYFYIAIFGVVFFIAWYYTYLCANKNLLFKKAMPVFITVFILCTGVLTAMTHTRIKAFQNGITLFSDASEKYPQHATPLYELTGAYMQQRDLENSLKVAQKITTLVPNSEEAHGFYANLLVSGKRYREVVSSVNKLISLNPTDAGYYMNKAILLEQHLNEPDSALVAWDGVIKYGDDEMLLTAMSRKANIYSGQHRHEEAITLYNEIIDKYPEASHVLMDRAICYFESGHRDTAIENMLAFIQTDPNNVTAYVNLGVMYSMNGEQSKACEVWQQAAALGNTPELANLLKNCN
jgi:Flp pilus assembly protein TadD